MHIDTFKQFEGLVYIGCIFQHIGDGGCRGQIGFAGALVRLNRIASHQVGNGQALFVDTVEGDKQTCQTHILVLESLWFEVLAESIELHVEGGDRFVPLIRDAMHDDANGRREVEVAPHQHIAIGCAHREG